MSSDTRAMRTVSKRIIADVKSLADVKYRRRTGMFIAEGTKCVGDTLGHFDLRMLVATEEWLSAHDIGRYVNDSDIYIARRGEMREMSTLTSAPPVIAVYDIPAEQPFAPPTGDELVVALDCVQDPGNLGTIIRTADWMGVRRILASTDTVDCWNPKTVQATMGAISRVRVYYGNLCDMIDACGDVAVYGTFLDGENIFTSQLTGGVVVMGNEGRGISDAVSSKVTRRLLIPPYPAGADTSESLNVATATAITLAQFRAAAYRKSL